MNPPADQERIGHFISAVAVQDRPPTPTGVDASAAVKACSVSNSVVPSSVALVGLGLGVIMLACRRRTRPRRR